MWCVWTLKQNLSTASLHTTELLKEHNYLNRPNTPPLVFPQAFLPNRSPRLTHTATYNSYTLNPHIWNEIADKMNELAEENRLIKQVVLGTYEK